MFKSVALLLALAIAANAASLGDVKHVIMLMMENRSFQHVSVNFPSKYTVYICKDPYSDSCSISVLCLVFEVLQILMSRSIRTAALFGTSKYELHLRLCLKRACPAVTLHL
jgi:hypothetical protein